MKRLFVIFSFFILFCSIIIVVPMQTYAERIPNWIKVGSYANYTLNGDIIRNWEGKNYYVGFINHSANDSYLSWRITDVDGNYATFHFDIFMHLENTGNNTPWGGLPLQLSSLKQHISKDIKINVKTRTVSGEGIVHLWTIIEDDAAWDISMNTPIDIQHSPDAKPFYKTSITNITPKGITIPISTPVHVFYHGHKFNNNYIMTDINMNPKTIAYAQNISANLSLYIVNLYGDKGGWTSEFTSLFALSSIYDGDSGLLIAGNWIDDVLIKIGFVAPLGVTLKDTNIFNENKADNTFIIMIGASVGLLITGVAIWYLLKRKT